jgi:predicted aldo/keto reductase-like oxidoreductase
MSNPLGYDSKKLGFGMMRLPKLNGKDNIELSKAMVDEFLRRGFKYFDTAYIYGDGENERTVKEVLVDRYPRESFWLTDKLPFWDIESAEELPEIFEESLRRTGAGILCLSSPIAQQGIISKIQKFRAWDFLIKLR